MRHFPELTGVMPRTERGESKPPTKAINPECWNRFAKLAITLGFPTEYALNLKEEDPDEALAAQFLQHAQLNVHDGYVSQIAGLLKTARQPAQIQPCSPEARLVYPGSVERRDRRCGLPPPTSHCTDRNALFLPYVYGEMASSGEGITSFFAKRDMFQSFFGVHGTEVG